MHTVTKKVVGVFVRFRYLLRRSCRNITSNVGNFLMIRDILLTKEIDVLILDLELEGLSSIF
jgi:hypothetical protein